MPFNGSGVFVRGYSWVNDATNSIPITASRMDADTNDIVTNGLGLCLTRDGQGSATSNLPMNGFKHTGCAPGVALTDYVTMTQISGFAPLVSPSLSGTPTAPTAPNGTNTTQIATTAFGFNNFVPFSGATFTGPITTVANTAQALNVSQPVVGMATSTGGLAGININANSPGAAFVQFQRNGNFGAYFGLDQDNTLSYGGWSLGNVKYRVWHEGASGLALQNPQVTGGMSISGSAVYGGVTIPHIFVQSTTPTALAVGDLWFF